LKGVSDSFLISTSAGRFIRYDTAAILQGSTRE
jgi:hypothetical protein